VNAIVCDEDGGEGKGTEEEGEKRRGYILFSPSVQG
jgi:hypothetical protein